MQAITDSAEKQPDLSNYGNLDSQCPTCFSDDYDSDEHGGLFLHICQKCGTHWYPINLPTE